MQKISTQIDRAFKRWLAPRRGMSSAQLRRELEQLDIDMLDRWAFGVVGDEILKLDPKDITVVHSDDLKNAEYQADRHPGGPKRWAKGVSLTEPVDVSVTRPGEFVLEDGHHRYLAARLSGRKLSAKIVVKGKPIEELLSRADLNPKTAAQLNREIAAVLKS
jgi:hypothetical protein